MNKKTNRGVTLIGLTVTIIVLLILASITTYTGLATIKASKLNKFKQELEIMQAEVNLLHEKYKEDIQNGVEINVGKAIPTEKQPQANIAFSACGVSETTGYKLFDDEVIKGLGVEGVEREYLVNIVSRDVICLEGLEQEGSVYYNYEDVGESNNVSETFDRGEVTFSIESNDLKIQLKNIAFSKYVGKGMIQYKLKGADTWTTLEKDFKGDNYSFNVKKPGTYIVRITDAAKNYAEKSIIDVGRIVDIVAYTSDGYIYALTSDGKVRRVNQITNNIFSTLEMTDTMPITISGVRKKIEDAFIDNDGKVYAWGRNDYGQLGDGTTIEWADLQCISDIEGSVLQGRNIIDIYSGWGNNSKIAKDSDGKIYTWGSNEEGQLGDGTTTNSTMPICISDIEGNALKTKNIIDVYAYQSSVIVKDSEGKIYAWGSNMNGQLGNGTNTDITAPICISDIEGNALNGKSITDIYITDNIVIARDTEGKIYTCGSNGYGQLGNGTTTNSSTPICISDIDGSVLKGKNITDICINGLAMIAKDSEGKIYTWGYNGWGQLGNGTTNNSSMPICISDIEGNILNGRNIVDIKSNISIVLARDENGKLYSWGENSVGQLGNGTTTNSSIPICISDIQGSALNGKNIIDINIKDNQELIIVKDNEGKIYTWGINKYGQLGDGTTTKSTVPICINDINNSELQGKKVERYECIFKGNYNYVYYVTENSLLLYSWIPGVG